MPRPVWTGSISFGLVNVPIKLVSATEPHRVGFHEFEESSGERIRYKRVAERSGHEVAWQNIQKGFEIGKDRFVVLTDEELKAAEPERTRTVEIQQFVKVDEIDPVSWDQSYYATPDGVAATKAYVLLRDAMEKEGRVAVGRFVLRTKEYLVCVRPLGRALALHTMFFDDEVRKATEIVDVPARATASGRELAMAGQLIASLAGPWKPEAYEDTFKHRVLALVKKKDRGETIEAGGSPKAPRIVDLMQALKATLAKAPKAGEPKRKTAAPSRTEARAGDRTARPGRRAANQGSSR